MLEIKKLNKSFNNKKVLKNINLNVIEGDRLAIIGPSGCGKSTLLRCINLLEKPDSGNILFEGVDLVNNNKLNEIRRHIGMVFQSFNLFDNLTVIDNITLAPVKLKIMDVTEATKKAKELLKRFNLLDKINNYPKELSGGQKQRVAIIRTLIMNPKIILFDEPTSALDPEMVLEVENVIKTIANDGMTMIIVSHEMNFIKNVANKVIFLNEGKIIETGTPLDIFENPKDESLKKFIGLIDFSTK